MRNSCFILSCLAALVCISSNTLAFSPASQEEDNGIRIGSDWNLHQRPTDPLDPSIFGTTTSLYATRLPSERKLFFAKSRFWIFFGAEENNNPEEPKIMLTTTVDGVSWTDPVVIRDGYYNTMYDNHGGAGFSVWLNNDEVHYCYGQYGPLYYRKGALCDDGSILWSCEEQLVDSKTSFHAGICVDTDGYPFIIYYCTSCPYVVKSSTKNGTWTEEFRYNLIRARGSHNISIVPLPDNKVFAFYAKPNDIIMSRLYDSVWGAEEEITVSPLAGFSDSYSAVVVGNDIHLSFFTDSPFNIQYVKRDWRTGWGDEVTLATEMPMESSPALSYDCTNGDLYCFWQSSPEKDHLYYRRCHNGIWEDPVDWLDESDVGFTRDDQVMCSYQNYGNRIGVIYQTKASIPYNLKFSFLKASAFGCNND